MIQLYSGNQTGSFTNDSWGHIVSHLSPIAIRATCIANKNLNTIVNQYKIMLAIENGGLSFTVFNCLSANNDMMKLFDDEIINELSDGTVSLTNKAEKLKKYIDTKKTPGNEDHLLHYFANKQFHAPLEILLKLGPNLNIIDDNYLPTALFRAHNHFNFKRHHVTTMTMLIDAGADFRIKNPAGLTCFQKLRETADNSDHEKITSLENHAKDTWEKLNRKNTPIPTRKFTIQNYQYSMSDFLDSLT